MGGEEQLTSGGWLLSSKSAKGIEAEIKTSEEVIRLLGLLGGEE
jgi:hypothetical protein